MVFILISSTKMMCRMARLCTVNYAVQVQTLCRVLRMQEEIPQQHQARIATSWDLILSAGKILVY